MLSNIVNSPKRHKVPKHQFFVSLDPSQNSFRVWLNLGQIKTAQAYTLTGDTPSIPHQSVREIS